MQTKFRAIHLIAYLLFSFNLLAQNAKLPEATLSVDQLRTDLQYLKKNLESHHPNLFLYCSKERLDHVFDTLSNTIKQPLTELQFYKHITILSSIIKDGHTVMLPSVAGTDLHNSQSNFLPYHISLIDNRLYFDLVCTSDNLIPIESEILSINGSSSAEIIQTLSARIVRDGNNTTYPMWILSQYFREYYSYFFGHPDLFTIEYKTKNVKNLVVIKALPKDSISFYRQSRYPSRLKEPKANEAITLKISPDNKVATLTIKDFHNAILKKMYHQNFKKSIDAIFEDLQRLGTPNLILDLRDNQGGDIPNGQYLLSYLLKNPFTVVQSYRKVQNGVLKECSGQSLGMFKPKNNAFKGKLIVLINGGSFSNTGIVAACLKRYNRATFIGEETGGSNKVLAGYTKDFSLPNTRIRIQIPTRQFMLDETLPLLGHGTMPDHLLERSLSDVIDDMDGVMRYAEGVIRVGE
ncbi:MAG: S41 family peptidase [Saprospiraceae bacterium]